VIAGIEFDFGKSTIRPGSRPLLDEAAKILNDYPDLQVEIAGHTDNVGAEETNIALSEKRAESVKSYLVSKGVAEERIKTRGAGPSEPLESNDTPEGRQKNRRIEFKLLTQ
jgi:outer membrane protein OmpA-like peptidoglycan-associated protein